MEKFKISKIHNTLSNDWSTYRAKYVSALILGCELLTNSDVREATLHQIIAASLIAIIDKDVRWVPEEYSRTPLVDAYLTLEKIPRVSFTLHDYSVINHWKTAVTQASWQIQNSIIISALDNMCRTTYKDNPLKSLLTPFGKHTLEEVLFDLGFKNIAD